MTMVYWYRVPEIRKPFDSPFPKNKIRPFILWCSFFKKFSFLAHKVDLFAIHLGSFFYNTLIVWLIRLEAYTRILNHDPSQSDLYRNNIFLCGDIKTKAEKRFDFIRWTFINIILFPRLFRVCLYNVYLRVLLH